MEADELLSAICRCEFVISLFVLERFSLLFLSLSKQLQAMDLDIFEAKEVIESIAAAFSSIREDEDRDFHELLVEAAAICAELEIEMRLPRNCERLANAGNSSVENTETYFPKFHLFNLRRPIDWRVRAPLWRSPRERD